jgi:hypothetical protein
LSEELHGIQRVPALLYNNPTATLESINCDKYEILSFEPLHDIGKHIENVLAEFPFHLPEKEAAAVKEVINCSYRNFVPNSYRNFSYRNSYRKNSYRNFFYRNSYKNLIGKIPIRILKSSPKLL